MAKTGIEHIKATVDFKIIEQARDLKEFKNTPRKTIQAILAQEYGISISIYTLDDWLYYRTRVYG